MNCDDQEKFMKDVRYPILPERGMEISDLSTRPAPVDLCKVQAGLPVLNQCQALGHTKGILHIEGAEGEEAGELMGKLREAIEGGKVFIVPSHVHIRFMPVHLDNVVVDVVESTPAFKGRIAIVGNPERYPYLQQQYLDAVHMLNSNEEEFNKNLKESWEILEAKLSTSSDGTKDKSKYHGPDIKSQYKHAQRWHGRK